MVVVLSVVSVAAMGGLVAGALVAGAWRGRADKEAEIRRAYWLVGRDVYSRDDLVVLVNMSRATFHVPMDQPMPQRVVMFTAGAVMDITAQQVRTGIDDESRGSDMSSDVIGMENLFKKKEVN